MNDLFDAAWEIHQFLSRHKIAYAIIGGFAVQQWGAPRLTVDVDLTVFTPIEQEPDELVRLIHTQFPRRVSDPYDLARRARLIVTQASNGRSIDISFAIPGYWDEMLERITDFELEAGKVVRVCSAEDLIIHKCIAGRPQDLKDIIGVIARQGKDLDAAYIRKWLKLFVQTLAESKVLERFENAWKKARATGQKKTLGKAKHFKRRK